MKSGQENNNLLIGQFEATVGAKSRVAMPSKFRKILGDKLILTTGYEKTLIIVSEKNWKELLAGTEGKPFIDISTRETRRFLLGSAFDTELDGKGRFVIPSYLRDFGEIKDEAVFLGLDNYVEMWDLRRWKEYREKLGKEISDISQKLIDATASTGQESEKGSKK